MTARHSLRAPLLALMLVPGLVGAVAAAPLVPMIQVTGEGKVNRAPDMATINLGVTAEAPTAAAAVAQMSGRLDGVLKRLKAEGIADKDMQSSGLNLSPTWNNPPANSGQAPKIAGFEASSAVSVKIRALDRLGGVLDAVVKDGANGFNGLAFGLADPAPAQDEARKAAVADAIHKAELYAAAAGVKLGAVQVIAEQPVETRPQPMMRAMAAGMAAAPVPVAQGEIEIDAEVQVTFAIAP